MTTTNPARPESAGRSGDDDALPGAPPQHAAPTAEFLRAAADFGIEFEPGDLQRLERFLGLLLEANRSFNLTAIRDPAEAWMRHVLDALTLLPVIGEVGDGGELIDVGSGGGLPGVPLAIVLPSLRVTLVEATGKKADFLSRAAGELGLTNIEVLCDRAERIGQDRGAGGRPARRERYDVVTARALGRLAVAAELCVPLARVGGRVLLVKGERAEEELAEARQALRTLGAEHAGTLATPTGRIVVLEKRSPTPRNYPRRDGEPKRDPLGARPARPGSDAPRHGPPR